MGRVGIVDPEGANWKEFLNFKTHVRKGRVKWFHYDLSLSPARVSQHPRVHFAISLHKIHWEVVRAITATEGDCWMGPLQSQDSERSTKEKSP